jgi:transcriptional regulator with XRE-family HTH domain
MKLRINQLRMERGLTVEALASKAGLSKSYLSEMMNGKKPINSARLSALASALNVSPIDLIDDQSMPAHVMDHLRIVSQLSPADQLAIFRHAEVLANSTDKAKSD